MGNQLRALVFLAAAEMLMAVWTAVDGVQGPELLVYHVIQVWPALPPLRMLTLNYGRKFLSLLKVLTNHPDPPGSPGEPCLQLRDHVH